MEPDSDTKSESGSARLDQRALTIECSVCSGHDLTCKELLKEAVDQVSRAAEVEIQVKEGGTCLNKTFREYTCNSVF